MNVCIITPYSLSNTHGTGVQILRLVQQINVEYFHLYWSSASGLSETTTSLLLEEDFWWWKWSRGRYKLGEVMSWLGLSVWKNNQLIDEKYLSLLWEKRKDFDVAYVVVLDEKAARRAVFLLRNLGCPYVVHIMDLDHLSGLNPAIMPGFTTLFAGASSVLTISEAIQEQVQKFEPVPTQVFPIVCPETPLQAAAPQPGQPLRLVMVGSLWYRQGLRCLAEAWEELTRQVPELELVYVGPEHQLNYLPQVLRKVVNYAGYMPNQEVEKILVTCHLAYLPGPCLPIEQEHYSRYSIPSRITDYLMIGLPVVTFLATGSATETFLKPLVPGGVRIANTSSAIIKAITSLGQDTKTWQQASDLVRDFAHDNLTIEHGGKLLQNALEEAVVGHKFLK